MPLRVRKPAPYFHGQAVIDGKVKEINLNDFHGRYLVLLFYPMDFTYVSPTEIVAFSDRSREFDHYNCSIVAVSTDSEFTHLAWMKLSKEDGGLGGVVNIPLLSDKSMRISRDYGVLDRDIGISHRGLYIIDQKAIVRHITMNDLEVGRSVDETLRLLRAFQFTDKYIKVCQVDWKPGDRGLRPDPVQVGRYFEGYFGISQVKSSTRIDNDPQAGNGSIEDKQAIKKPVKVKRAADSPSNDLEPSMSIDKDVASDWGSSYVGQQPHQQGRETLDNALTVVSMGRIDENASTGKSDNRSFDASNRSGLQIMEDDFKDVVGRATNAKGTRSYKLYSTTVPMDKIVRNGQKVSGYDIQTTSKSDTMQRYHYPKAQEKQIRKDPKAYLHDFQLNQYIRSYYNASDENLSNNKHSIVLRDNSPDKQHRYELKNDGIFKYNDRMAKGNELKAKQAKEDERESFNKTTIRKPKPAAKETENVKDMARHPLNDVLNVRPVNITGENRSVVQSHIKSSKENAPQKFQADQFDESKKYPKSNQYQYRRQQEHSSSDNTSDRKQRTFVRGQVEGQNVREDHQYRRVTKNHPASLNEAPNQRNFDSRSHQQDVAKNLQSTSQTVLDAKALKSSLKRNTVTSRQNNFNTIKEEGNHATKMMKPILAVPQQYTEVKLSGSYDYYELGGRVKGRSDGGRNNKNWGGKVSGSPGELKQELNYGHLVI